MNLDKDVKGRQSGTIQSMHKWWTAFPWDKHGLRRPSLSPSMEYRSFSRCHPLPLPPHVQQIGVCNVQARCALAASAVSTSLRSCLRPNVHVPHCQQLCPGSGRRHPHFFEALHSQFHQPQHHSNKEFKKTTRVIGKTQAQMATSEAAHVELHVDL